MKKLAPEHPVWPRNYPALDKITNQGFLPFVTKSTHLSEGLKFKRLNALQKNDPDVIEHAGIPVSQFCLTSV